MIQKVCPRVQWFVCPTHSIDNFLKKVATSVESIKIQTNLMGDEVEIPTLTLTKFLRFLT